MTLAGKGSRRIVVGDVAYRWTVRRKPTYSQGIAESPLSFAVELADRPAGRLLVSLPVPRPDNWLHAPSGVVTPALVARCITDARDSGWDPARPGPPLTINLPAPTAERNAEPAGDPPFCSAREAGPCLWER
jgi:hypothetical protein